MSDETLRVVGEPAAPGPLPLSVDQVIDATLKLLIRFEQGLTNFEKALLYRYLADTCMARAHCCAEVAWGGGSHEALDIAIAQIMDELHSEVVDAFAR